MTGAPADSPEAWRRTSPLSFVVRAITGLRNLVFAAAALLFGSQGWGSGGAFVIPAIAGIIVVSTVFTWIAWRRFRYRIGDHDIRVEHGLLSRSARTVPYERIQDVSLEQALVARLFGMVEVKFETGAGGKDELRIAYVTAAEADALRETVRARRSGAALAIAEAPPGGKPSLTLFEMNPGRLALFGVFEFSLVIFAVLGGLAQQFDFLLPIDIWDFEQWLRLAAGPGHWLAGLGLAAQAVGALLAMSTLAAVGLATGMVRTVLRDWGFRLEQTPKGLRRRRGLLTRTDVVMPLHRVQALRVTTGVIRRRFGWHGLEVVSLGLDEKSGSHVVVPFATIDEIAPVVRVVGFDLPGDSAGWRRGSVRRYRDSAVLNAFPFLLMALAVPHVASLLPEEVRFPSALPSALLAALAAFFALRRWFLWRHDRHALDGERIHVRRGWLAPRLVIASSVKLQSVEIAQGPLARRRGYADVRFGVAGGTLTIEGIQLAEAHEIRDAVIERIAPVDFSRLPG